jgi:hypothetical protein
MWADAEISVSYCAMFEIKFKHKANTPCFRATSPAACGMIAIPSDVLRPIWDSSSLSP